MVLKRTNLTMLSISMLLALVAALAVNKELSQHSASPSAATVEPVVVAIKDVPPHTVVTSSDVEVRQVPKSGASADAVSTLTQVVGHYTKSQWFAGQQVINPMVAANDESASFPLQIPQGERAFTIANDAVTGVDHLISTGDHVDIVATSSDKDMKVAKVLLQNVLVLYVDTAPAPDQTSATASASSSTASTKSSSTSSVDTLTLAISAEDVAKLDYARMFGQLHVVLRNPGDTNVGAMPDAVNVFGSSTK